MTRPRAGIAALLVLTLAACSSRVGGDPVAEPDVSVTPAELTSEVALGDLTTIDPCSLTDPEVFDELGSAGFTIPESLEYCTLTVDTSDEEATVWIGLLGTLSDYPELEAFHVKDLDGGLWLSQPEDEQDYCAQFLVFPDDVTLEVATSLDADADVCAMVEAGMDKAVEVILAGEVRHREPDADSLVSIDPCELVDDEVITAIPAFAKAERARAYPGRHNCYWEPPNVFSTSIRVEFGAGLAPLAYQDGANENPIAGRPSATNPHPSFDDGAFCAVETGHIPFEEVAGQDDIVELAGVYVHVPAGQVNAGCQAAVAVAQVVWPELPSVS